MSDRITVISFDKPKSSVVIHLLTPVQRESLAKTIAEVDKLESHGFQEVLGYIGRRIVVAIGGYWDGPKGAQFFHATSFGGFRDGKHTYSTTDGVVTRNLTRG